MNELINKDFIINVGPGATFRNSGTYHTSPQDIDDLFEKFSADQVRKIALFFHGGLVSEQKGLIGARKVAPFLAEAGAVPVCFVWETGLMEVIAGKISTISKTKLYNKAIKSLINRISSKLSIDDLSGRSSGTNGFSNQEIELELRKPNPFGDFNCMSVAEGGRSANNLPPHAILENQLRAEFTVIISADYEFQQAIRETQVSTIDSLTNEADGRSFMDSTFFITHLVKISFRVIDRFLEKRDHDFFPTIVEELLRELYLAEVGAGLWKLMKDKAQDMWRDNQGRTVEDQFVGRYFLERLSVYIKENPGTKVDLIGHSAGSIAICHLLQYTQDLNYTFKYRNIIFLAPACRVDLFKREISDQQDRFEKIRIFTMNNKTECEDIMIPYFYTHSLLYLISGILEDRGDSYDSYILGLQRHIAYEKPYNISELESINNYLYTSGFNRVSFSKTDSTVADELQTKAAKHGHFDEEEFTLKSIQYLLRQ